MSKSSIMVFSPARSGSTVLSLILGAHSEITNFGESHWLAKDGDPVSDVRYVYGWDSEPGFVDCAGTCIPEGARGFWVEDGFCDDGSMARVNEFHTFESAVADLLSCGAFAGEEADCTTAPGNACRTDTSWEDPRETYYDPIASGTRGVYACDEICVPSAYEDEWVGDEYCDDGTSPREGWTNVADFSCDAFPDELGDCPVE